MAGKGILLDNDNDLKVLNGTLAISDSLMQEVSIILQLRQGNLKTVPLLGPDLIQLKKTNLSKFDIEQRLRVHLALDKKEYKQVKQQLQFYIK